MEYISVTLLLTFLTVINSCQSSPVAEVPTSSDADIPTFTCINFMIFYPIETCTFRNLNFNQTHQNFHPVPATGTSPTDVKSVDLGGKRGSTMKVLTSDICNAFPNVQWFDAHWLGLEDIHEDAFVNCVNLEKLRLYDNKLTSLNPDLFKSNQKLRYLDIDMNRFKEINVKVFEHTPSIEYLNFNDNQIKRFDVTEIPILANLKVLRLANNLLSEINEEEIMNKFPALKDFIICPNERIEYVRLRAMTDFLKGQGVAQFGVCRR